MIENSVVVTVPEYFTGKTVFITGGSGFLGKVLIEKLLRSCPDIKKIYVLLRAKKGKSVVDRLSSILQLPLFDRLKTEQKGYAEKVQGVEGDVAEVGLGLNFQDRELLKKEVSVIFHAAATVRFDDPLKHACLMNTRGTVEAVQLYKELRTPSMFTHVSTTYCNLHQAIIDEKVYPTPMNWRKAIELCETTDDTTLSVLEEKILGEYPNTYTFTKALAEAAVEELCVDVPAIIFRPSIVISTLLEPIPGWVDNLNGPVGLLVGAGKGVIRICLSDPEARCDMIPVDNVIKALVTATWDHAVTRNTKGPTTVVYNCSSTDVQSFSQTDIRDVGSQLQFEYPIGEEIWRPTTFLVKSRVIFYIGFILMQLLPAFVLDSFLKLLNKKPILMRIQRKIFAASLALECFTTNQWFFKNDHLNALEARICEKDRESFEFGLRKLSQEDKVQYFTNAILGTRMYLFNKPPSKLDEDRKHFNRLYWIDIIAKLILTGLLLYGAVELQIAKQIFYYIADFYSGHRILVQGLAFWGFLNLIHNS